MKHKPHKSILIYAPAFPSGSISEGHVLHLKTVYQEFVERVNLRRYNSKYTPDELFNLCENEDAILVIGNVKRHPKSFFKGPYLEKNNRKIPIAWLPYRSGNDISQFADMVQEVHQRTQDECVVALLSQRHPRFVRIVERMNDILQKEIKPLNWSSDVILRDDLVNALEQGIGLAAYFGHGRPIGWVGYYGFRAHHFEQTNAKPIGSLLSLCCKTASRKRTPLSFCEQLVIDKKCAATFGAVDSTLHTDNTRWSVGICSALLRGAKSIGELIIQAMPQNTSAYKYYRIIGDPLAPVYSTKHVSKIAQKIKTYP